MGQDAGIGAMIISPTRELAIQIFNVLRKVGQHGHMFSAGLVIGGKGLAEEREALSRMNIVVCTPGRMLQHLSQTAMVSVDSLRMLVLDEADRIMDMGFQHDVDAIIEYLPPPGMRQTLLFSATQTKRVSDLARLSLKDPEYISVHESSASATPSSLQQNYIVTSLPEKLSTLWSFLLTAKKSKLLVFLSSGKQVRHVYESFRHLQPGIPLLHLHGRQKHSARLEITQRFSQAHHVCLFATDVAARGLDFPAVDWVVQVDCPEDADTYIHRVGRTARFSRSGRAILFLDPNEEEGFISRLATKKVPIERINARAKKQKSIQQSMQGLSFKFPDVKHLGQKAFVSYVRSLRVQKDRDVFGDLDKYDLEGYAASMGLPGAPRIKFMKGDAEAAKKAKNAPRRGRTSEKDDANEEEGEDGPKQQKGVRTRYDRMFERVNQDVLAPHYAAMLEQDGDVNEAVRDLDEKDNLPLDEHHHQPTNGETDDLFDVKSRFRPGSPTSTDKLSSINQASAFKPTSKRQQKLLRTTAGAARLAHKLANPDPLHPTSNHLVFDDETGEARPPQVFVEETAEERQKTERERRRAEYLEKERLAMAERDVGDKEVAKRKRREKRDKRKARERGEDVDVGGDEDEGDGGLPIVENGFEDIADLYGDDNAAEEEALKLTEGEVEEKPRKKRKKEKRRRGSREENGGDGGDVDELERQAMGLLD